MAISVKEPARYTEGGWLLGLLQAVIQLSLLVGRVASRQFMAVVAPRRGSSVLRKGRAAARKGGSGATSAPEPAAPHAEEPPAAPDDDPGAPIEQPKANPGDGVFIPPRTVAVIIPAHNEESVIRPTLISLLSVYEREDIFVHADACTDATVEICREYLPYDNVYDRKENVGKSRGLEFMLHEYIVKLGYQYVSIIDADTTIEPNFLVNTLKTLRKRDVACTVGQVKSRWYATNLISVYRTYLYTMWQTFYKRLQSLTNSITIASGCSTTWKVRVLEQLEFNHEMSTEDFSLTMQVHRKRLGQIKYVSSATVWTQDPFSARSYSKQTYRWNRAWWESVRKYKVGLKWVRFRKGVPTGLSVLDVSTLLLTVDIFVFFAMVILLPVLLILPFQVHLGPIAFGGRAALLYSLAWQYGSVLVSALLVAVLTRQPRVFIYSPLFLLLMYMDILLTVQAIGSTIKSQYRNKGGAADSGAASVWSSPERRKVG